MHTHTLVATPRLTHTHTHGHPPSRLLLGSVPQNRAAHAAAAAAAFVSHASVIQHHPQGFPTIKFFYVSNGKIKSSAYNGGRSAKELVTFALDKVGTHSRQQWCSRH